MEASDEELMNQFNQGDEKALGAIFVRYKRMVFNYSLRMLGNRADAEDVTSEVFCVLSARRYSPQPHAKFTTWLFTVIRNACLDRIRQKGKSISMWFKKENSTETEEWSIEDQAPRPDENMEHKVLQNLIQKALSNLPSEQREAIILREYQRLSYEEISVVLQCSLEKVKILIFRARERLRLDLAPSINEENHG